MTELARTTLPQHYRAIWPVLTPRRALADLIDEASAELPRLLAMQRLRSAGKAHWSIRPGSDIAGSGGHAEVLVLDVPVLQVPRRRVEHDGVDVPDQTVRGAA